MSKPDAFGKPELDAASQLVLGVQAEAIIDSSNIASFRLAEEEFEDAKGMAHALHQSKFQNDFTPPMSAEVIALTLATELLQGHANGLGPEARREYVAAVIIKAIVHAESLITAYDDGKIKPIASKRTFPNGQKHLM